MNMVLAIDTQKSYDLFISAGFDEEQAKALLEFERLREDTHLATKQDLAELRSELKEDITLLREELIETRSDLKQDMVSLRSELSKILPG